MFVHRRIEALSVTITGEELQRQERIEHESHKGPWGNLVSLPASGVGDPGANPGGPISSSAARSFAA